MLFQTFKLYSILCSKFISFSYWQSENWHSILINIFLVAESLEQNSFLCSTESSALLSLSCPPQRRQVSPIYKYKINQQILEIKIPYTFQIKSIHVVRLSSEFVDPILLDTILQYTMPLVGKWSRKTQCS